MSASGRTIMWFLAPPSAPGPPPPRAGGAAGAGGGAGLVDVAGDRGRADERDRGDAGVLEQAVDRDLVAVDDVEHAGRQAGIGEQLGAEVGARRIALAGLEDEG